MTIHLDDDVARSVEWALETFVRARSGRPASRTQANLAAALDVLSPEIVAAEGRALLRAGAAKSAPPQTRGMFTDVVEHFDAHAPNAFDAIDDGFGPE